MDELRFNKVFASFLFAGLLIMAGIQIAHVLVPEQQLAENAYVIEVPEATELVEAAPKDTGPEPILALLASADVAAGAKVPTPIILMFTGNSQVVSTHPLVL